jgi:hypothetical protein
VLSVSAKKEACACIKYIPVTSQQNIAKHLLNKKRHIPCSMVMHLKKSMCEKI